jgi:DNA-binding transcriptional ArsR family regulator
VLRALAEPRRVAIIKLIRRRELPAGQIADNFKTTRSAISQHLSVLKKAGLLSERRRGTSRLYRIRPEGFAQLRTLLDTFWEDGLARLKIEAEQEAGGSLAAEPLIKEIYIDAPPAVVFQFSHRSGKDAALDGNPG